MHVVSHSGWRGNRYSLMVIEAAAKSTSMRKEI
jgi:hypothetical protein